MKLKIILIACMALGTELIIASMESTKKNLAVAGSNLESLRSQGNRLFIEKRYSEALPYLIRAYEMSGVQNNVFARVTAAGLLGSIYADGLTGQQNFDQALKYLNEAGDLIKNDPALGLLPMGIKPVQEKLLAVMWVQGATKNNSGQYPDAFELFTKVYDNSRGNPSLHARAAQALAVLYSNGSGTDKNIKKAFKLYTEAYKLSRNIPDIREIYVKSASQLGKYWQDDKDYTKALQYYHEAYNASENLPYPRALVSVNIGRIYSAINEPIHAEKYLDEAYQLGKQNDYKDIIVAAASSLGKLSGDQKDHTNSMRYFLDAYNASANDPCEHASAANNIGIIYSELGDPENAIKYLNEADALSKQYGYEDIGDNVANSLGVLYTNGKGIEPNDDEAIKHYEKAYKSKDLEIRALVAHNLGRRYLYSRTKRDFDKARKYLEEAATSASTASHIREAAIQDLYAMKQILLIGVDNLIAKIEEDMPSMSYEHLRPLLKQAWESLRYAGQINIPFGSEKDLQFRNSIAEKWRKFVEVRDAARRGSRTARSVQAQAPAEEELLQPPVVEDAGLAILNKAKKALGSNQLDIAKTLLTDFRKMGSKNIDSRKKFRELEKMYAQQKVADVLNAFEKVFKDYSTQPNKDVFEKAVSLLEEATELASYLSAIGETSASYQISRHYEELYKKRGGAKMATSSQEDEKKMSSNASSSCAVSAVACESTEEHKGPIMAHSAKKVKKFLVQHGFKLDRTAGSHHHYRREDERGATLAYHNEGEDLSPSSITNLARQIEWDPQALNDALLSMK